MTAGLLVPEEHDTRLVRVLGLPLDSNRWAPCYPFRCYKTRTMLQQHGAVLLREYLLFKFTNEVKLFIYF